MTAKLKNNQCKSIRFTQDQLDRMEGKAGPYVGGASVSVDLVTNARLGERQSE